MKLKLKDIIILVILFVTCANIILYGFNYTKNSVQTKANRYQAFYNEDLTATTFDYNGRDADHPLVFQYTTMGDNSARVWPSGQVVYVTPNTKIYLRAGDFSLTGYTYTISNTNLFTMLESSKYDENANGIVSSTANVGDTFTIKCKCFTEANARTIEFKVVWEEKIEYYNNGSLYKSKLQPTMSNTIAWNIENAPQAPVGYTFAGWVDENDNIINAGSSYNQTYTAHNQTTVLTAKWEPITYTVTLDANDGTGQTLTQNFTYDVSQKLTKNTFVRKGYEFLGWSESNTATTATYSDEATIKNELFSGKKLYAVWEKLQEYTITYENLEGNTSNNINNYIKTDGDVKLNDPDIKSKHTFIGWFKDSACTQKIDNITYELVKELGDSNNYNVVIYAKIKPILTVKYENKTYEIEYDNSITLEEPMEKEGCTYVGLYKDENYTQLIENNKLTYEEAEDLAADGVVKLYAKYEPDLTINCEEISYTLKYKETLKLEPPTEKEGFKFIGWYIDEKYTQLIENNELKYADAKKIAVDGKLTLYAKYEIEYKVQYHYQNIENDEYTIDNEKTVTKGAELGTIITTFEGKAGEGFVLNNEKTTTSLEITKDISKNVINVYYDRKLVKISFNNVDIADIEIKFGAKFNPSSDLLVEPSKKGFDFDGWFIDTNNNDILDTDIETRFDFENTSIESSIVLSPIWKEKMQYTIKYNIDENTIIQAEYTKDNTDFKLYDPVKTGYTFIGWFAENGNLVTIKNLQETIIEFANDDDNTINLYAKFEAITYKYTIEYYYENIENNGYTKAQEETVEKKDKYGTIIDSEKINSFKKEKEGFEYFDVTSQIIISENEENNKIIFRYRRQKFKITISVPDSEPKEEEVKYGAVLNMPEKQSRLGYEFVDWYVDENSNGVLEDNEKYNFDNIITKEIRLDSKWSLINYEIKYDLNGGKNHAENPEKTNVEEEIILKEPTKKGYDFAGWYDENDNKVEVINILSKLKNELNNTNTVLTKIKLYAKWTPKKDTEFTILYIYEGIDEKEQKVESKKSTGETDKVINIENDIILPEGFELDKQKSELKNTIKPDGTTEFKVYLKRKKCTITFEAQDEGKIETKTLKYGESLNNNYTVPTKKGYIFDGWILDGKNYDTSSKLVNDINLIAKWKAADATYKVEYYKENLESKYELIKEDINNAKTDEKIKLTPSKIQGYELDEENSEYLISGIVKPDNSLVLKVFYKRKTYIIKYQDSKTGDPKEKNVKYGEKVELEKQEIPEKQGYTFVGWVTQSGELFNEKNPITDNLELKLCYTPNTDTPFKVNYYKIIDKKEYKLIGSNIYYGTTDTITQVELKDIEGYKINTQKSTLDGKILADGSTVFNVYYEVDESNIIESCNIIYIILILIILLLIIRKLRKNKRKSKRMKK